MKINAMRRLRVTTPRGWMCHLHKLRGITPREEETNSDKGLRDPPERVPVTREPKTRPSRPDGDA